MTSASARPQLPQGSASWAPGALRIRMTSQRILIWVSGILIVGLLAWFILAGRLRAGTTPTAYGRFTGPEILALSEPMCLLLASRGTVLNLSATPTSDNAIVRTWSVEAVDQQGHSVVHLTWDATSGDLISLGVISQPTDEHMAIPMDTHDVSAVAASWMSSLRISADTGRWEPDGTPTRQGRIWTTHWRADNQRAIVRIEHTTHRARFILCWRLAGHSKAQSIR